MTTQRALDYQFELLVKKSGLTLELEHGPAGLQVFTCERDNRGVAVRYGRPISPIGTKNEMFDILRSMNDLLDAIEYNKKTVEVEA